MTSLLARTVRYFSSCGLTDFTSRRITFNPVVKINVIKNHHELRCYSSLKKTAMIMEEEKNGFFVVRKGDLVGVYNSLVDCQAQVGSSICDPPVSVYKGYTMPKEAEEYLLSCGLKGALYSIRATDLTDELFGSLVPCPFEHPRVSIGESNSILQQVLMSKTGRACILEFDGACKGNPGQSGAGAVLRTPDGTLFCKLREGLGITTNNVAEYRAMILGLRYACSKGFTSIHVMGDSKLVCMQIQGLWKVRNKNISKWYGEAKKLRCCLFFKRLMSAVCGRSCRGLQNRRDGLKVCGL